MDIKNITFEEGAIIEEIVEELQKARNKFERFASNHEGIAVLWEEMEELWDEIKRLPPHESHPRLKKEAVQVAAMALRFIYDRCQT